MRTDCISCKRGQALSEALSKGPKDSLGRGKALPNGNSFLLSVDSIGLALAEPLGKCPKGGALYSIISLFTIASLSLLFHAGT